MKDSIFVMDIETTTVERCKCGRETMFVIGVHGNVSHLCENCLAKLGKHIIDGLT